MALEKECYRQNLEALLNYFGDKRMLTVSDVSRYTGLYKTTVKSRFEFKKGYISVVKLASAMS